MIASWQKKSGRAATGYISADTQAALLREAAPALARYDEEQKKLTETHQAPHRSRLHRRREPANAKAHTARNGAAAPFRAFRRVAGTVPMTVRNGAISGSWTSPGASEPQTFTGRINASGEVQLTYNGIGQQTYTNQHFTVQMTGRMAEGVITAGGGRDRMVGISQFVCSADRLPGIKDQSPGKCTTASRLVRRPIRKRPDLDEVFNVARLFIASCCVVLSFASSHAGRLMGYGPF